MALTMTLHNFPEGFAVQLYATHILACYAGDCVPCLLYLQVMPCFLQVAFSSFTSIGPVMALAIAVHNIPEVNKYCIWHNSCPGVCWPCCKVNIMGQATAVSMSCLYHHNQIHFS